jgi:hypothetical protein
VSAACGEGWSVNAVRWATLPAFLSRRADCRSLRQRGSSPGRCPLLPATSRPSPQARPPPTAPGWPPLRWRCRPATRRRWWSGPLRAQRRLLPGARYRARGCTLFLHRVRDGDGMPLISLIVPPRPATASRRLDGRLVWIWSPIAAIAGTVWLAGVVTREVRTANRAGTRRRSR